MNNKWILFSFLNVGVCIAANGVEILDPNSSFGLPPRVNIEASGGTLSMLDGDVMLPLFAGLSQNFYTNAQTEYDNDQNWFGGLGLGYRQVYEQRRILGAYVFGDYNSFNNGSDNQRGTFWIVNTGVESLGNLWDFRLNAYVPVSTQTQTVASDTSYFFAGHQEFSQLSNTFNYDGPGVDAEIGRINVPYIKDLRLYVGGYYFSPKDQTGITGVASRAEYSFGHAVALTLGDNYDNYAHNTFQVGIRFTLGGIPTDKSGTSIDRRLLDPVTRNIATLAQANTVPIVTNTQITGTPTVFANDIYFFNSAAGAVFNTAAGANNCTFENPCIGTSFNQSSVNAIAGFTPNATLFFTPGTYNLNTQLTLNNGQSMFGRTWDYSQAASGSGRPIFTGGLALADNNTLDSFILMNDASAQQVGIEAINSNNIVINNLTIGSETSSAQSYDEGVSLLDSQNVAIDNSQILANVQATTSENIQGILSDNSQFTLNNTTISENLTTNAFLTTIGVADITLLNNSQATIQNSQLSATASGRTESSATGIQANTSNFSLLDTSLSATATSIDTLSQATANATGINFVNGTVSITNSEINVDAFAQTVPGASTIVNVLGAAGTGGQLDLSSSNLTVNGSSAGAPGGVLTSVMAINTDGTAVNVDQSSIVANAESQENVSTSLMAIQVVNGSLNFTNSEITASAIAPNSAFIYGILAVLSPTTVINSSINVSGSVSGTGATTSGAFGVAVQGSTGLIENSTIFAQDSATSNTSAFASAQSIGSFSADMTVLNNNLTALSDTASTATGSSSAVGIDVTGGTLNQSGNTFNVVATGTTPTSESDVIGP
jgi:hypothetical protein